MHALLPPTKVLAILAICMYSLGEHIRLGMKNTISLEYAKPGCGDDKNKESVKAILVEMFVIMSHILAD